MIFFRKFALIVIIGLAIAFFNFLLNSAMTEYAIRTSRGAAWIPFGALARIAIAGVFVLILYQGDVKNIIAYIIGYSLHYAAMVVGLALRKSKT